MTETPRPSNFTHGPDVLTLLNRDLANEMQTMLMYMSGGLLVRGADSLDIREVAEDFAKQDFTHARKLASRIVELDGVPQLQPQQIVDNASIDMKRPHDGQAKPLLKNALENELQSVLEYRNQIQNIAFTDPATRLLLEGILADKERQVEQIRHLIGV
ncbi:MAG TPA: ferritin-like domain-containing protein [Armatimonadota bacterium]|jgi:bacterioferritin